MHLTTPLYNCEKTAIRLIHNQKIRITDTTIKASLAAHPDYPSLLSISDFLHNYNIENVALRTKVEKFSTFPVPFIAHITTPQTGERAFTLVHAVKSKTVVYEDPVKGKPVEEDINRFKQKFTGHALLVDSSEAIAEKDYARKHRKERLKNLADVIALLLLPAVVIAYIITLFIVQPFNMAIYPALFLLLSLAGSAICFLLLLFEIDRHNPLVKEICQGGKKVNCQAVLQSKASGIMGISWSSIGFCYFTGLVLSQVWPGAHNASVSALLIFLNLLSLPYILFSVYYQWKVVKQWCILCLTVQAILVLQFLVSVSGNLYKLLPTSTAGLLYLQLLFCFSVPPVILYIMIPALKKAKEGKEHYHTLQRFKNNEQVFEAILSRQRKIQHATDGLGITLGNPNAKWRIIKVCNPYCGPCAKAHPVVEELISHNRDIQLQIIFTASGEDTDLKTKPVEHLLAIASTENESVVKQALDDWYNAPVKDYSIFAAKYPVGITALTAQKGKVQAMKAWCDTEQISFTPTFFVNGFQLPDTYHISDLKLLLTAL